MTLSERGLDLNATRSDRVRARRARHEREIESVPRERKVKPRRRKKPRRRYSIPVSAGAEVQLPGVPNVHIGARMISLFLMLPLYWGLRMLLVSTDFNVSAASIPNGANMLTTAQLRSMAQVDGQSVFTLDPQQIEARLESYPEVALAKVRVGWPNKVEIEIQERTPLVEWNDAGRTWWISSDGIAFIQHGTRPGLVQIRSEIPILEVSENGLDPVVDPQLLLAAAALVAVIPDVKVITYDLAHGLGFPDPRGWDVFFGTSGDIPMKAKIYHAIALGLEENQIPATLVDITDQTAPYYLVEYLSPWQS